MIKFSKKSILSVIAATTIVTVAPLGISASKAEAAQPVQTKLHYTKNITFFKNNEDVQAFFQSYIKELEERLAVKIQLEEQAKQPEEKPQEVTPAPVEKEQPKQEVPKEQPKQDSQKEQPKQEQPAAPVQPAPTPQPPAQQPKQEQPGYSVSAFEQKVVELTNAERAKHGLSPLNLDTELSKVAREKSKDMKQNNYFSHTSPTFGSPFDMMRQFGISYRTAGENIAMGQRSPEEVVTAWMNSEGHRANILNGNFTHIGVGHVEGNYWTQMFIGK
ncbi:MULTISPECIES: CAP domain-containing protein [Bacillus]|uniref:CAP domain-containing protein n=1 Tax=Bacillus TaxID=1386 RepID=UPI000BB8FEA5|nr:MULTISPECIES: CAP domain-containing protein [Bacillus]